jgi:putative ABC transport system ATP-binding protein
MISGAIIKLDSVWKVYNLGKIELPVLKGVSLEIAPGSFVVILGPSGSGKSTMLNMIGCLDLPTKGKIFLDGKNISEMSEDQLAQVRGEKIGFIFQQFNLLQNLTAIENVMLPMIFQGKSETERRERAKSLLISLGLGERINHRPAELSGGEQQRIATARALANDPEVIVADEPTGNLDSTTGKKIMEILVNLHIKEQKTIIVVTHDANIANYSNQIINIKDGQLILNHQSSEKVLWSDNH